MGRDMSEEPKGEVRQAEPPTSFAEFLEGVPPGSITRIADLTESTNFPGGGYAGHDLTLPEIQIHCSNEACNGPRFFRTTANAPRVGEKDWTFVYIRYVCSNCRRSEKTFSLAAKRDPGATAGRCYKFGELPDYGPPTPARLIKLIGPDRELFLKGRRCENQGLGIGAFVYYRRVVESQKNRILDEVIKVSKKVNAPAEATRALESAKAETQFSKALESIKHAIPQALLVNGHNPLTLLHSALSDGLHDRTDERCLELASSIRVVLAELSERLSQALKDEAELSRALSHLMQRTDG